jgi:putative hydrolase of the HAD superfamily
MSHGHFKRRFNAEDHPDGLVIFDGDDTLWITEPLYDRSRSLAAEAVASAGLDAEMWDKLERELDVQNVETLGLSSSRFPTSCVAAYEQVARMMGRTIDPYIVRQVQSAAATIFSSVAPLVPNARQVLADLSWRCRLVLYTQGDPDIQEKRIADSGLAPFFDLIVVVPRKTEQDVLDLTAKFSIPLDQTIVVGNSVRSDINPALVAGVNAIWVDRHVWELEKDAVFSGPGKLYEAVDLDTAHGLVEKILGSR